MNRRILFAGLFTAMILAGFLYSVGTRAGYEPGSCAVGVSPGHQAFGSSAGASTVSVTAGCNWTATTGFGWITLNSGVTGSGNGSLGYSVASNSGERTRIGSILVGGRFVPVTQSNSGGNCTMTVVSVGQTVAGSLSTTDCRSIVDQNAYADLFTFSGQAGQRIVITQTAGFDTYLTLFGPDGVDIALNNNDGSGSTNSRIPQGTSSFILPLTGNYVAEASSWNANVTGAYNLSVSEDTGAACMHDVFPTPVGFSAAGGEVSLIVTTPTTCAWTAYSTLSPWIRVNGSVFMGGFGNGVIPATVAANTSMGYQIGKVLIAGKYVTIVQDGTGGSNCLDTEVGTPQNISIPGTKSGNWAAGDCASPNGGFSDLYWFEGYGGQELAVTLTTSSNFTELILYGPSGWPIVDIEGSGNLRIPAGTGHVTLPVDGTYIIDAGSGSAASYSLNITFPTTQPSCPTISGINPTSGSAGSSVTITGSNFTGVNAVKFANNVTAQFTINSDSSITATVPAGAVTGTITISKTGCTDVQTQSFTVSGGGGGGGCSTPSFASAVSYAVGTLPVGVAIQDLNKDGKPDLAVSNYTSNSVSVLLNNGSGAFGSATNIQVPGGPTAIAALDFNGDGNNDLVTVNYTGNSVSYLPGISGGGFSSPTNYAVGTNPRNISIADFNGDGKLDLAIANRSSNNVSVLVNTGAGFTAAATLTAGTETLGVTTGDFNGDGKQDIAASNGTSNNVSIFLGNGNGTFSGAVNYSTGTMPFSVAAGDLNGDGKLDLATANLSSGNISVLIGNGSGGFGSPVNFPVGTNPINVAIGDVNLDGKQDIAVAVYGANQVALLKGDGSGSFAAAVNLPVGTNPNFVGIGDLNGDGKPDLAVTNYQSASVSVLLNNCVSIQCPTVSGINPSSGPVGTTVTITGSNFTGANAVRFGGNVTAAFTVTSDTTLTATVPAGATTGAITIGKSGCGDVQTQGFTVSGGGGGGGCSTPSFASAVNYAVGTAPVGVAIQDFNKDGKPDLAVANFSSNTVSVLLNIGSGAFGAPTNVATGNGPTAVAARDFNGDGNMDLVTVNYNGNNVSYLPGITGGGFSSPTNYPVGTNPYGLGVADFNGDGKPDLAVANVGSNSVSILINNGAGFTAGVTLTAGAGEGWVATGDFNGDGKQDIAVSNSSSNTVSVFLNNGNGTFGSVTNFTTGANPISIAAGDLNGDGKLDLVTTNNNVSVLIGNGNGGFAAPVNYSVSSNAVRVSIGDLNLDGKPDLAVAVFGNQVAVLKGDGNGGFATPVYFPVGTNPNFVGIADLNGDSKPDLAVANFQSASVSVLLNSCIDALCPIVSGINPTSGPAGTTVTITGSNFTAVSAVRFGGNVTATFSIVNDTTITATVPAGATTGAITLGKSGCSDVQTASFQVTTSGTNPVPVLLNLSPNAGVACDPAFTLTVGGYGFVNGSVIRWNGADLATSYINSTQLTASISASLVATQGTATIGIFNPSPGGGLSNTVNFTTYPNGSPVWDQTGGPETGDVEKMANIGTQLIIATGSGHIFTSLNNGQNWIDITGGQIFGTIWDLLAAGSDIYVGCSDGVYLSSNRGLSWTKVSNGLPAGKAIFALGVNGSRLFAWASSTGMYISDNNGGLWTFSNTGLPVQTVNAIIINGSTIFAGGAAGIYVSANNGQSWTASNTGLQSGSSTAYVLSMSLSGGNILAGSSGGGLFLSSNNGQSWTQITNGLSQYLTITDIGYSAPYTLISTSGQGAYLSTSNGAAWSNATFNLSDPYVRSVLLAPTGIFAGTQSAGIFLLGAGDVWNPVNSWLRNGLITDLETSGSTLFASTYQSGIFSSTNNGQSWTTRNTGLPSNKLIRDMVVGNGLIFAGSSTSIYVSSDNGQNWTLANSTPFPATPVTKLAILGSNLFAGTTGGGVSISTNNGATFTAVNNGLPVVVGSSIRELFVDGTNLYAAGGVGVYVTSNNGQSWSALNNGLPTGEVTALAKIGNAFFAGTQASGVYISTNNGANWSSVNNGLTNSNINDLATYGANLYAATGGGGVFVTSNNGQSWSPAAIGLRSLDVRTLKVSGNLLFAGTNGGSVHVAGLDQNTCQQACPAVSSINPTSGPIGTTVTITGSNFTGVSAVKFAGNVTATFSIVNDTTITATVPAGATTGAITITKSGCGDIQTASFQVTTSGNNPVPVILSINPAGAVACDASFTLTIGGYGFINGSVARWNGTDLATSYINSTLLTATVPATLLASAGTPTVAVFSPAPGGGLSNTSSFTVYDNGTLVWKQTGGPEAGNIQALAVMDTQLFAGTYSGIVYTSFNNGQNWIDITGGLSFGSINEVLVSGSRVFISTQKGVYTSSDKGLSWTKASSGLPDNIVYALAANGSRLFASVSGTGIYISDNNGTSWTLSSSGIPSQTINDILVSGSTILAAGSPGVYVSTNNGQSWTASNAGLTTGSSTPYVLALALGGSGVVFAGTSPSGLFISSNNGQSWTQITNGLGTYLPITDIAYSAPNAFITTAGLGVYTSNDNGQTWKAANTGLPEQNISAALAFGTNYFVGTGNYGIFKLGNDGQTWASVNGGIRNGWMTDIEVSNGTLLASTLQGGIYSSSNNGQSWNDANNGLPASKLINDMVAGNGRVFVAVSSDIYISTNNGQSWTLAPGTPASAALVTKLAMSGTTLIAGMFSKGVAISNDNATTWTTVNNGLPTGSNTQIRDILVDGTTIYVCGDAGVYTTTNTGQSWTQISSGLPAGSIYSLAKIGNALFAGTNQNGVYISTSNGTSWTPANAGISNMLVNALAVYGSRLYAATYSGVYVTSNNGSTWTAVNIGLKSPDMSRLKIIGNQLFGGSYSRSVYVANLDQNTCQQACPAVSGINPASGGIGGTVTISGTGFTGVASVKFSGNVAAQFSVMNDSQITATVPAGAVSGPIMIGKTGCGDVTTSSFTIIDCATVSQISPASGPVGSTVTISGNNLTGVSSVKFSGNVTAAFTVVSNTQIAATVPSGASTGPITISKPGCGDIQTSSFAVTILCPAVSSISPTSGGIGTPVTITGSNLAQTASVKFANNVTADFTVVNGSTITANVPAGAVSGPITLSKPGCNDSQSVAFVITVTGCSTPSFAQARNFTTGTEPIGGATADFNSDGKPDIALPNYSGNTVSVLFGDGSGGFGPAANYAVGNGPYGIVAGDFNLDNKPDLVTVNYLTNNLGVFLNNGNGTFGTVTYVTVGNRPRAIATADFNNDGRLDLAVANSNSNTASILLGNGLGGFSLNATLATGTAPFTIVTGDFNKDGRMDVAVGNSASSNISVFSGNGTGGFSAARLTGIGYSPYGIVAADFNKDGRLDLATANLNGNNVAIFNGSDDGTFGAPAFFAAGSLPVSIASADFNLDGKPDIAVANSGGTTVSVLLGNGAGGFGDPTPFAIENGPHFVLAEDFNGDTKPDLAAANRYSSSVSVLLNSCISQSLNPAIGVSPAMLDFGAVAPGASRELMLTIGNTGGAALLVTSIGFSDNRFSLISPQPPFNVAASGQQAITVRFAPTSAGTVSGTMTINSNDATKPALGVSLSGAGLTCPTVTGLSPSSGLAGSTVTISGTNFTGVSALRFSGNAAATFTVVSDSTITATVPASAASGPVTISKPNCNDIQTAAFTVIVPQCPTVTGLSPSSGLAGSTVTISGTNFTGVSALRFSGNAAATFTVVSDSTITATVPASAASGPITISKPNCNDIQTAAFTVTQACADVSISTSLSASPGGTLTAPLATSDLTGKAVISYEFTLNFDPAVLRPQATPFDKTGTLSSGLTVSSNSPASGQLRISAFGATALAGSGTLLNLKFDVIGQSQACSNLTLTGFKFNEGAPCANATAGRACVAGYSIAGEVTYCISPKAVPGVQLTAAGSPPGSGTTDASGAFSLNGLGSGAYTLAPAKTSDAGGISSFDAALVSQQVVGQTQLTECQRTSGDASGDGSISSFDAALIAQYVVGISNPASKVGTWKFTPAARNYTGLAANQTGQNFSAVLVGDVSGNWTPASTLALAAETEWPAQAVTVTAPSVAAMPGIVAVVPILLSEAPARAVSAWDLEVAYDAGVLLPADPPVEVAGTLSGGMNSISNDLGGRLLISAYGTGRFEGTGTLALLRFRVIGSAGSASALKLQRAVFNEGRPRVRPVDGSLRVAAGPVLSLSPARVKLAIGGRTTLAATLSTPLPFDALLWIASSNPEAAIAPARVIIPAGRTLATFEVTGRGPAGSASITASLPSLAGSLSASATVDVELSFLNASAASYRLDELAPESIAAAFGADLTNSTASAGELPLPYELGGVAVTVTDSRGVTRPAQLFFASPGQVNYLVPEETAAGPATITIRGPNGSFAGAANISPSAPGLFTTDSSGSGIAAALALRVRADGSMSYEPAAGPIDLGPSDEQVCLIIFGTGLRSAAARSAVTASIGGIEATILYAGPQGQFAGLDQINVKLDRRLSGKGTVRIALSADGMPANSVEIIIR